MVERRTFKISMIITMKYFSLLINFSVNEKEKFKLYFLLLS